MHGGDGTINARDPWEHITILSGNIGSSGDEEDNVYHVVTGSGTDDTTLLDGFIIYQGYTEDTDPDPAAGVGAGMLVISGTLTVRNTVFLHNKAENGAGMMVDDATPTLENVLFLGNTAESKGGAIASINASSLTLVNGTFTGNTADNGGGLSLTDASYVKIVNTSFSMNEADTTGGGLLLEDTSDSDVQNTIMWDNDAPTGPQIHRGGSSTADIAYSLVEGSYGSGGSWDTSLGTDKGGNLDADPLFVQTPDPGYLSVWGTEDDDFGDLRLKTGSPAVDQGANKFASIVTTDQPGNPRVYDQPTVPNSSEGAVDLGAYEAPPTQFYVDGKAMGTDSGLSWVNAFTGLQPALKWGRSGPAEIWVAEGNYTPGPERMDYFQVRSRVSLYGGFPSGGGDGTFGARNWTTYPTTLSGEIGAAGDNTDNVHNVLYCTGSDDTAILDGFIVTGGYAEDYVYRLTHRLKHFYGHGGGFNMVYCDLTITDVIIDGNHANYNGGGVTIMTGGSPTFNNVDFKNNQAQVGGGLDASGSPILSDVVFEANQAAIGGGMASLLGNPTLEHAFFYTNTAISDGGGIYVDMNSEIVLIDTQFLKNSAGDDGGGIYIGDSTATLLQTTFRGNVAGNVGGGMICDDCDLTLVDALFSGNSAESGGGFYNTATSDVTMINSTFSGNEATASGGGMHCTYYVKMYNTIFWGNRAGFKPEIVGGTGLDAEYSLINGGCPTNATCTNLLTSDPQFARAPDPGLDGTWGTSDDDYGDLHLMTGSPAIDAGDNTALPEDTYDLDDDTNTTELLPYDLDGNPRLYDVTCILDTGNGSLPLVDIGAYEVQTTTCLVFIPLVFR